MTTVLLPLTEMTSVQIETISGDLIEHLDDTGEVFVAVVKPPEQKRRRLVFNARLYNGVYSYVMARIPTKMERANAEKYFGKAVVKELIDLAKRNQLELLSHVGERNNRNPILIYWKGSLYRT